METTEAKKRTASGLEEPEVTREATRSRHVMVLAGLPTLHETEIIAAPVGAFLAHLASTAEGGEQVIHATVEWDKEYYSTKSGELLDTAKVLQGCQKELSEVKEAVAASGLNKSMDSAPTKSPTAMSTLNALKAISAPAAEYEIGGDPGLFLHILTFR